MVIALLLRLLFVCREECIHEVDREWEDDRLIDNHDSILDLC